MKIVVTGCAGMLGRAVMARMGQRHDLQGVDLAQGDLTDPSVARELVHSASPDWIINCAAWTAVDAAETQQDAAMAVNAGIPANLARSCDQIGCGLTQISTDYVFDGRGNGFDEDSTHAPLNHYGLTKARGEDAVRDMRAPWQIVRTSWLFGDGPNNFVRTIAQLLLQRDHLDVVDDQRGNPTYTEDLAAILEYLVTGGHRGIFHATNQGHGTWFDFARAVAGYMGQDPDRIRPCGSSRFPRPARRPACSILRSRRLEECGYPPRPPWEDAVQRYCSLLQGGEAAFPLED